jgi:hypothetical protein
MAYEARLLRQLKKLVENESRELKRIQRVAFILGVIGWLTVFAAFLEASKPNWPLWVIATCASVGGICIGLSIMLKTAHRQWPVVRRFLNIEAIKDAEVEASTIDAL